MAKPEIGTVIRGTWRPEDLMPALYEELERLDQDTSREWGDKWYQIEWIMRRYDPDHCMWYGKEMFDGFDPEAVSEALHELFIALDELAPQGYYFGAHPGDSSDFGWWSLDLVDGGVHEEEGEEIDDFADLPCHEYLSLLQSTEQLYGAYVSRNPQADTHDTYAIYLRRHYLMLAKRHVEAVQRWFRENNIAEED